jgi:hypothetical protein
MKAGLSLVDLAREIERQQEAKKDYIARTNAIEMVVQDRKPILSFGGNELPVKLLAHDQIAEHTGIPARYYKRMMEEEPTLLCNNVDAWFRKYTQQRMIRTMDGGVRALLSDRYRPLENNELAEAVLPVLSDQKLEIMSSQITETRLYIKAVDQRIRKDMPTGRKWGDGSHQFFDTLSPAIIISNSEVGCGALSVEAGVFTKVCTNLAIASSRSMRKYHLGGKQDIGENIVAMLSDDTRRARDEALWKTVRDVTRAAFNEASFGALVDEMKGASEAKIEGDPVKVVELSAKRLGLGEAERSSVLKHLISGGDLSKYGLHSAITRTAEDLADYDRATEFERMGFKVLEMPKSEWKELAAAA